MAPAQREEGQSIQRSDSTSVTQEIIKAVSRELDVDPLDLPPIYQAIDPDALERVLDSNETTTLQVRFHYEGCEIIVTGQGAVTVKD